MASVLRTLRSWPFVTAAGLRLLMLAYGAWQDAYLEVKYTDLDYSVFTDGAELVATGRCPFERPTYRYTPLLALLLTPNIWLHGSFGKLVFSGADLAVGAQVRAILLHRRVPPRLALRCACVWLFNPLVLNVSTRGNFESLVALLVLGSLLALLAKRPLSAAALLAASAHLKPFTVIYLPAFLVCIDSEFAGGSNCAASASPLSADPSARARGDASPPAAAQGAARPRGALVWRAMCAALSRRRVAFGVAFALWSAALGGLSYGWCGMPRRCELKGLMAALRRRATTPPSGGSRGSRPLLGSLEPVVAAGSSPRPPELASAGAPTMAVSRLPPGTYARRCSIT
eukprot:Transcript_16946.p1 GENE.Transcript_16946~~Transcript_16946.p1  ORF type:complete len:343 (-),score=85.17 Transcript_16946:600-1628(-)